MTLVERDKKYTWHPYTQMKNALPVIPVVSASKTLLYAEDGKTYIDAVSSWWTNLHGHAHPHIATQIYKQASQLEHVIFAGFTHQPAVDLAESLLQLLGSNQEKVFYSDNGSTAVEVALKMAFQYWHNQGQERKMVIAFENAYHGDTFGAMSVSGRNAFTAPFESFLFNVKTIPVPLAGKEQECIRSLQQILNDHKNEIASFIFEPLVQGTAGMIMYDAGILDELIQLCRNEQIVTIADEVMTGFGRTGKFFASDYLRNKADIFCFSKGITGGFMPLGVTTCTNRVFEAFLSDQRSKTFFHGHSYTANPLACSAALASLQLLGEKETIQQIENITQQHKHFAKNNSDHQQWKDIRVTGTILAMNFSVTDQSYFSTIRDKMYSYFIENGILLRPLGNILYVMPPYCISEEELNYIYHHILAFCHTQ
jgi:adenosylmethionine---8-amino-7-oxononanoate aminotransferase